jgi:hypothetical protein
VPAGRDLVKTPAVKHRGKGSQVCRDYWRTPGNRLYPSKQTTLKEKELHA